MEELDREKSLELALIQIQKEFGKGSIIRLGDGEHLQVETIPTGSIALDLALGVGGLPRGRIVELFGSEGVGKSTLALHVIAEAQKKGGTAAYLDVENVLDPDYARNIGVNTDDLLLAQPDTAEEALSIADTLIRSGSIDVLVLDSVAALLPKAELEGEMGSMNIGLQARLMSHALRKLSGNIARGKTCMIFINQLREKIGGYGESTTTPGGRALKFYSTVRFDCRRTESLKDRDEIIGNRVRVRVVKNKLAAPFKQAEFDIIYGEGISRESALIDMGLSYGILQKKASWITFDGQPVGQGRENVRTYLMENPLIAEEIENLIRRNESKES